MEKLSKFEKLREKEFSLETIRGGAIKQSSSSWTSKNASGGTDTYYYRDSWNDTDGDGTFDCNESGCEKVYMNIMPSPNTDICSL